MVVLSAGCLANKSSFHARSFARSLATPWSSAIVLSLTCLIRIVRVISAAFKALALLSSALINRLSFSLIASMLVSKALIRSSLSLLLNPHVCRPGMTVAVWFMHSLELHVCLNRHDITLFWHCMECVLSLFSTWMDGSWFDTLWHQVWNILERSRRHVETPKLRFAHMHIF